MKRNDFKKKILVLLFLGILPFTSCGVNGGNNTPTVEVESAYDKLTEDEKLVFNALKMNLSSFYEQSSVRIVAAGKLGTNTGHIDLKIQGKNKLGGTVTKIYTLCYKTTTWTSDSGKTYTSYVGEMYEPSELVQSFFKEKDDVSIKRLNAALKEYFEDMGLL